MSEAKVTLSKLYTRYRGLFHPTQDWFIGQRFMETPLPQEAKTELPVALQPLTGAPTDDRGLPHAVELVQLYVLHPKASCWEFYLWCCDKDASGERVFVGGLKNGRGFEIHRHLHLTDHWKIPLWLPTR